MSRLIDADALKEATEAHGEKIAYVVSFLCDIDLSPTIDAIPVEWLRNVHKNSILTRDDVEFRDWLIEKWRKEQEVQDG